MTFFALTLLMVRVESPNELVTARFFLAIIPAAGQTRARER